jgi:hypothetical protein
MNWLLMYLRQNSQIHNLPSGRFAYSSGNGASYQVWISYSPKRMVRIRNVGAVEDEATGGKGNGDGELRYGVDGKGESRDRGVDG